VSKPPHLALTVVAHDGRKVRITAKRYSTGTRFEVVELKQLANGSSVPSDNGANLDASDALRLVEFVISACRGLDVVTR
jgi:hypothetical protein